MLRLLLFLLVLWPHLLEAQGIGDGLRSLWNKMSTSANRAHAERVGGLTCQNTLDREHTFGDVDSVIKELNCSRTQRSAIHRVVYDDMEVLESLFLDYAAKRQTEDLTCEQSYLSYFDKDPRSELGRYCRRAGARLPSEGLSPEVQNQVQIMQNMMAPLFKIRELKAELRRRWPDEFRSKRSLRELKSNGDPEVEKLLAEINLVQSQVWNSGNPRVQALINRETSPDNKFDPDIKLWRNLCDSRYSLFNSVIKPTKEESEGLRQRISNINGRYNSNSWFARSLVRSGAYHNYISEMNSNDTVEIQSKSGESYRGVIRAQTDDYVFLAEEGQEEPRRLLKRDLNLSTVPNKYKRIFLPVACRLENAYGIGSELSRANIDRASLLLGGVGAVAHFGRAALLVRAGTATAESASVVTAATGLSNTMRLDKVARGVQAAVIAGEGVVIAPDLGQTIDSCFGEGYQSLRKRACNTNGGTPSKEQSIEYLDNDFVATGCVYSASITAVGLGGGLLSVADVGRASEALRQVDISENGSSVARVVSESRGSSVEGVVSGLDTDLRLRRQRDLASVITGRGPPRSVTPGEVQSAFSRFDEVTTLDNRNFIRSVRDSDQRTKFYVDFENVILKQLNDSVLKGNKDLSTSLTNLHKNLFLENSKLKSPIEPSEFQQLLRTVEDPEVLARLRSLTARPDGNIEVSLSDLVTTRYSDYKSIRMGLAAEGKVVERLVSRAVTDTNSQFGNLMSSREFQSVVDESALRGIAGDPSNWFMAGTGRTLDQAATANRQGRRTFQNGRIVVQNWTDITDDLTRQLTEAERQRRSLQRSLDASSGIMEEAAQGERVLSVAAIDIFRKTKPARGGEDEYFNALKESFNDEFSVELSNTQLRDMRSYFDAMDGISPSLLLEERVVVDLEDATSGLLSVDFAGQGARNLHEVMMSSVQARGAISSGDMDAVIQAARTSEVRATRYLDGLKESVESHVRSSSFGAGARVQFSGDDGLAVLRNTPSASQQREIVQSIVGGANPSEYRIVFVEPVFVDTTRRVTPIEQKRFVAEMESIEKSIRTELRGQIPREILNDMAIASRFNPSQRTRITEDAVEFVGSQAEFMLAGNGVSKLTEAQRLLVRREIEAITGRHGFQAGRVDTRFLINQ